MRSWIGGSVAALAVAVAGGPAVATAQAQVVGYGLAGPAGLSGFYWTVRAGVAFR